MRLGQLSAAATTRFGYDGLDLIAEYDGSNGLLRRYVHGPNTDEPLVQYEGSGTSDRRFMHADERGSVVAISDTAGNALTTDRYDEYGKPQSTNAGRFQYTGQTWLPELGLYYYKARMYAPQLGRFMQTDPIGYGDGLNWYNYVGGDPVNRSDSSGMLYGAPSAVVDGAEETQAGDPTRSWDWMGASATHVGGRLDQTTLDNAANAWTQLNALSTRTGVSVGCLLNCSYGQMSAASLLTSAGLLSSLGNVQERISNATDAYLVGRAGEEAAARDIVNAGYTILGQQVYVQTPLGLRITDILAISPSGVGMFGFEVKSGPTAFYSPLQRQKDQYISFSGGQITSRNPLGGGLGYGSIVKYPTILVLQFSVYVPK